MSKKTAKKIVTKSDFVRAQGKVPAKDVVARAAKRGMKLTERYVYVIRSADRTKAKARQPGLVKVDAEHDFRHAVAELGLTRSRAVLTEIERSFVF